MMKPTILKSFDLPSAWYRVVQEAIAYGYDRPVFRGAMTGARRKELDYLFIEITNPNNRPLVPDVPDGVPPPTSMDYVNLYLGYLMTPHKEDLEDYTYGERISGDMKFSPEMKNMHEIDKIEGQRVSGALDLNQLGIIMGFLGETPETNRSIIAVGKDTDLLLKHPPCLRLMQFKVRYGKLHVALYFRSWDLWGGFPSNLAAIQLMKEWMGKKINVEDGSIFASSMGAHLYNIQWDLANLCTSTKSQNSIPKENP